jgi:hypothetical protein
LTIFYNLRFAHLNRPFNDQSLTVRLFIYINIGQVLIIILNHVHLAFSFDFIKIILIMRRFIFSNRFRQSSLKFNFGNGWVSLIRRFVVRSEVNFVLILHFYKLIILNVFSLILNINQRLIFKIIFYYRLV